MKKRLLGLNFLLLVSYYCFSQSVGIGTVAPDASAALDITATNRGLLIPRMSISSINAITNPARGLLVYDSVASQLMVNIGTPAAPNWQALGGNSSTAWNLTGNGGTNPANQFVGTTDNQPLRFRINNIQSGELHPVTGNIFWGVHAGEANTSGFSNIAIGTGALKFDIEGTNLVAIGDSALYNNGRNNPVPGALGISNTAIGSKSLFANTIGSANTAGGTNSLRSNTDGTANTAFGVAALFSNTIGGLNTAIGGRSLSSNTTGNLNTATGWEALHSNTTGVFNSAFGSFALDSNTIGNNNTAAGFASLHLNTTGEENTATGIRSLFSNTTGGFNTAMGSHSLFSNTTGESNTATGFQSLFSNTSGELNTAYGFHSLRSNNTGTANTAVGNASLFFNTTGTVNTAIGDLALNGNLSGRSNTAAGAQSLFANRTGDFNTAIGVNALNATIASSNNTVAGFNAASDFNLGSDNTIIGANADATRDGLTNATAIGAGAIVNASNKVRIGNSSVTVIEGQVPFTTPSDGRFKFNIKEDVKGLDFIMNLRPVTYQFDVTSFEKQWNNEPAVSSNDIVLASYNAATAIRRTGFIAQEVEKAARVAGYNFSGLIKPKTEKEHYSLSYDSFVVPLVKAIQEQQQIINDLKNQNENLKKINAGQKKINGDLLKRIEKLESSFSVK